MPQDQAEELRCQQEPPQHADALPLICGQKQSENNYLRGGLRLLREETVEFARSFLFDDDMRSGQAISECALQGRIRVAYSRKRSLSDSPHLALW